MRLLLRENRHEIKNEYRMRIAVVFFSFLIAVMVIWFFVLLSLYMQVRVDYKIADEQLNELRSSEIVSAREEYLRLSELLSDKGKSLDEETYNSSFIVDVLVQNSLVVSGEINISSIDLQFSNVTQKRNDKDRKIGEKSLIDLKGVASTRSDLVEFQKQLLEDDLFIDVDIPYSSFTASTDIPFDIRIETVELGEYLNSTETINSASSVSNNLNNNG
jgi:uncharacterized membrane protein